MTAKAWSEIAKYAVQQGGWTKDLRPGEQACCALWPPPPTHTNTTTTPQTGTQTHKDLLAFPQLRRVVLGKGFWTPSLRRSTLCLMAESLGSSVMQRWRAGAHGCTQHPKP